MRPAGSARWRSNAAAHCLAAVIKSLHRSNYRWRINRPISCSNLPALASRRHLSLRRTLVFGAGSQYDNCTRGHYCVWAFLTNLYTSCMNALIIFCAKYLIFIVALIAGAYWLTLPKRRKLEMAIFGAVTLAVAFLLLKIGGTLYFDPRPFVTHHIIPLFPHAPDNGFPSDHTTASAAIAVTVLAFSRKLGVALLMLAAAIGLARIAAHVHSPIDIIGGFVFAALAGAVAYVVTPKIVARFAAHRTE